MDFIDLMDFIDVKDFITLMDFSGTARLARSPKKEVRTEAGAAAALVRLSEPGKTQPSTGAFPYNP